MWGQVPCLTLDDGKQLYQSNAILRYLGANYKGKKGETLYPKHANPELAWEIDNLLDYTEDHFSKIAAFSIPLVPAYKDKETHFANFILEIFPNFLETIEQTI